MTVSHLLAVRTAIATAVLGEIDAGTAGNLVFRTSGDVEVATLALSTVSGTVSGAVLTFAAISDDTSATGGVVTKASIENSSADKCLECAVATTASDINLSSTTIGAGDTVSVSSLTYTAPT